MLTKEKPSIYKRKVLVLNKNWTPIKAIPLKDAITLLFGENGEKPKAKVIEPGSFQQMSWQDWSKLKPNDEFDSIQGAERYFKVPEIIVLTNYDKVPQNHLKFSRRNLFKRDHYQCQYCGKKPPLSELSLDHVVPSSRGGQTTWDNILLSCMECNRKKADLTLAEANMLPLKKPHKPKLEFFMEDIAKPLKSWNSFISEIYWTAELENDNND